MTENITYFIVVGVPIKIDNHSSLLSVYDERTFWISVFFMACLGFSIILWGFIKFIKKRKLCNADKKHN